MSFLALGVTGFLFALVLDFFFAAVALDLANADLLPAVVLGFCVAAVAVAAFVVVIALRVEVFVLRGAPCTLRSVFLWWELPLCDSADALVLPSETFTAS